MTARRRRAARAAYETRLPRTYISSGYQGTLGWGVATALGAKHALGDR
jgi:acetolactate synthase-1/2/3 large subunit